jgi:alpha-galactosidase
MKEKLPVLRLPDSLFIFKGVEPNARRACRIDAAHRIWESQTSRVELRMESPHRIALFLSSNEPVRRIFLRWKQPVPPGVLILGDTWERSYGCQEWRGPSPHRPLPWYFLMSDKVDTAGWGVETGASAIACWRVDTDGITLELDVRSGGVGVELGARVLKVATILHRIPHPGETPFAAARAFCHLLSPAPLMPREPIVGHNDWYWLYGKNSASLILEATRRFVDLYPGDSDAPRPWSVIDDGWQDFSSDTGTNPGGPWKHANKKFRDMEALAANIKSLGARPGIWFRPLFTYAHVPDEWQIKTDVSPAASAGHRLDPSVPAVLDLVREDISRLRHWGYELIKHDFSTFDVSGRWGSEMDRTRDGFSPDGWTFADSTRTTAEILVDFYRVIRDAAGPNTLVLGCNTVSHLAAGFVDIQRIGDDTSASNWDITRRMGVNTLAFRAPQHGAFYAVDADCVPVSPHIPWPLTAAWLELVASSGTPLFLSMDPAGCHCEQNAAIKAALHQAAKTTPLAEPLDWFDTSVPSRWRLNNQVVQFAWSEWDLA